MSSDAAMRSVGPVNLENCAREAIHVPGFTQMFGVLLATPTGIERISQISKNSNLIFGSRSADLVGQKVSRIFGESNAKAIAKVLREGKWKEANPIKMSIERDGAQVPINVIVHRYDGLDFMEVEAISAEGADIATRSFQQVRGALTRLQEATTQPDLWQTVVSEVHQITGYDRVMVYKFDRDDHGYVIAEEKRENQVPFLGLHYPASDIPDQARRLYRNNWIRYIPDTHYVPVPLIPVVDEDHNRLTDMTHCVLRSVSPIHCEYLHNMGVAASMSISILRDNRLWGLIVCHNDTPKHLPYELRGACELVGQVLSTRIAALEDSDDSAYKSKTNSLQAQFLAALPQYANVATALVSNSPNLLDFIPATGAAVCSNNRIFPIGRTPNEDQIRLILRNTLDQIAAPIFVTDRLQDRIGGAHDLVDTASGVLCFTASRAHDFHVLWFRTEQVQVMKWGGEPVKAVEFDGSAMRLSPRRSFEVWKQEVRGKSTAWLHTEIDAAAELRAALMSLLVIEAPLTDPQGPDHN
jgi:light-regulated signal transduction histidine kinase (bacteriophytochrome)